MLGAALVAVLFTLSWLLAVIGGSEGSLLTDRVNLVLGVRIARLAAALPTLEHFERPDLLARLEQLTANRRTLAGAPRQLIGLFGQALRAIGIVVLLATVYLPVLVVPLLALAPALAGSPGGRVQQRADDELAEDRRLLASLFCAGDERRRRPRAAHLRRHRRRSPPPRRADRAGPPPRGARGAAERALWRRSAGWCSRLGVVGAIVVLVLRAAARPRQPRLGRDGGDADAPRPDPDLTLDRHRRQLQHRGGRRAASCCGSRTTARR